MVYSFVYEFCLIVINILSLFVPKVKEFLNSRDRISNDIRNFNNSKNNFILYPSDYGFPDQTIYFAGYSISTKRENLKINRN